MVVEDDPAIAQVLTDVLDTPASRVFVAETGAAARRMLQHTRPDLILLDLMLPDLDGLVLCSEIRAVTNAPVVICSASAQTRDVVLGLKLGADDFIPKPFDINELEARVEAVLRRTRRRAVKSSRAVPTIRVGSLMVDPATRKVSVRGERIPLTPTQFRLIWALAQSDDKIVSRPELAARIWGYSDGSTGAAIDVLVRRVRLKLNAAATPAPSIVAIRGFGYRLVPEH